MEEATIVAIATPPGRGAIGLIRISGAQSLVILKRHCQALGSKSLNFSEHPRQMLLCHFVDGKAPPKKGEKNVIDQGLALYYRAPHSYTGEDSAEFFLHGNPLLLAKMIAAVLESGLARLARPGEFTQRAYLNKKLDLTQAEAVGQIIKAQSEWELRASQRILGGELKRLSSNLRSRLLHLKAELEAGIDFALKEEEEEEQAVRQKSIQEKITEIQNKIKNLLDRSKESARLRSIFQIAIVGIPNAGKSSLFNRILGWDRSIVSPQMGTTRDYVSEEIQLEGLAVRLVDTAGLRRTQDQIDQVEKEGIVRARKICKQSQLVLHLIDGSQNPYELDLELQPGIPKIDLLNKCDLPQSKLYMKKGASYLCISCHTEEGLSKLRQEILACLLAKLDLQNAILLEERQTYHLRRCHRALENARKLTQKRAPPDEIIALELDQALKEIGAITAPIDNEEVLGRIFSMFCVGK